MSAWMPAGETLPREGNDEGVSLLLFKWQKNLKPTFILAKCTLMSLVYYVTY